MDYFLLYLILRLDVISSVNTGFAIITGICFAVALLVYIMNPEDKSVKDVAKPWISRFCISFVIVLFLAVMVPDTKQTAVIYCLPKIVNNKQVQKVPNKLLELSNIWLDEQIAKATAPIIGAVEE